MSANGRGDLVCLNLGLSRDPNPASSWDITAFLFCNSYGNGEITSGDCGMEEEKWMPFLASLFPVVIPFGSISPFCGFTLLQTEVCRNV